MQMALLMSVLLGAFPLCSQFLPTLQAGTPEEFDDYLRVEETGDPAACDSFVRRWPNSELLARVYEIQFEAYRKQGDVKGARRAGELALRAAPANLPMAAGLALVLANAGYTEKAEHYASGALRGLETFRAPRSIPLKVWTAARNRIRSRAHAALGLVAFHRDKPGEAIREFERAIELAPEPDAGNHLRLGRLYRLQGRTAEAKAQFQKAAATGDKLVQELVEAELANTHD
jgi:tetratricopeptide (TPR) repeat protein